MDYKRLCNIIGILSTVVGLIFQVFAYGYWWAGLIAVILVLIGLICISGATARFSLGIISFVTSAINFGFMLWMLINFTKTAPTKIYHPILFIVFDLIIVACGVLLILLRNAELKGKEYNPLIKKLNDLDNQ